MSPALGARIVIGGVSSGVGKTTIATGLLAALRARGVAVAAAKVGPDFIDPGYHALASGRPPRNLDAWLCGPGSIAPLAARTSNGADLLVIEGVMGLFDGADDGSPSSTADVAKLLDAPVLLVVDASGMSASIAAVVEGFRDYDRGVRLSGVVCNRVGSDRHERLLREALEGTGVPVVGCLRRDDSFSWRDRHLGLVPVVERADEVGASLDRLAAAILRDIDLAAVESIARSASPQAAGDVRLPASIGRCRIAVAGGRAFTFAYTDNLEALQAAGAELVPFDPLNDPALPEGVDGLVVGGGFPEVYGDALAANEPLLADVRTRVASGLTTWAECAGLLWLAQSLDDRPMAGVVPTAASMRRRVQLGYRRARTNAVSPIGPVGTELLGHEHHYSACEPAGAALTLSSRHTTRTDGFASSTLLATYLHHHAGGDPSPIEAFVASAVRSRSPSSP